MSGARYWYVKSFFFMYCFTCPVLSADGLLPVPLAQRMLAQEGGSAVQRLTARVSICAHQVLADVGKRGVRAKLGRGVTGGMPAALCVQKWLTKKMKERKWCARQDSNLRPTD